MKNNIKHLAFFPVLTFLAACETQPVQPVNEQAQYRTITVVSDNVDTKTSIEYENSDYSHLVWDAGDKVAYVVDCMGELSAEAEVSDGSFNAAIPASAGPDNKLYVVYPADKQQDKLLMDLKMTIPAAQQQEALTASTGIQVPMYAVSQIPEPGSETVKVRYQMPAAVVRFAITTTEHSEEKIQSVSMKADKNLAGDISFSGDATKFEGKSNTVTTTVANTSMLRDGGYVYMTVMRGTYTNVTVSVTTDKNTYVFDNGTFELDTPGATLFKVNMSLEGGTTVPPVQYFKKIEEGEVFSKDNKYLIAYYYEAKGVYYIATHIAPSALSGPLEWKEVKPVEEGIEATDDVTPYAFTIAPVAGTDYCFLSSEKLGEVNTKWAGYNYIGGPDDGSMNPGRFYRKKEEPGPTDELRYLWDISVAADGITTIACAAQPSYSIMFYFSGQNFAPCKENTPSVKKIVLLKLQ